MNKNENIINLGLENTRQILNILKIPYQNLKIIHIAGTNGKGSVCQFVNNILIKNFQDFKKVGLYTSPHLHKINERIKINNQEITDDELNKNLEYVEKIAASKKIDLTYFELLTVVAIKYFCDNSVEIAIFEVGLGGRLDATNVFEKENILLSVLTSIGLDHTEYLGDTLEKILDEKMGILKQNVPVVSGVEQESLKLKIKQKTKELNSQLYEPTMLNFELKLKGKHQILNANIANTIAGIINKKYGFKIKDSIKETIEGTILAGRLELLKTGKCDFLFDVSHNEDGVLKFVEYFKDIKQNYLNKILVLGLLKDKNYKKIVAVLLPHFDEIWLALPESERALNLETLRVEIALQDKSKKVKIYNKGYSEISDDILLNLLLRNQNYKKIFCILGSFYLIAPMREEFLKKREVYDK